MRAQIAYWFSHNHNRDGGAYYNADYFVSGEHHAEFIETLDKQIKKNDKQPFVQHHLQNYAGRMPMWTAVELLSFSTLSKLYNNMILPDQKSVAIAQNMDPAYLSNWLHCFAVLRNTCAHYGRLYSIVYTPPIRLGPKTLRENPDIYQDTLFAYIVGILRILPEEKIRESFQENIASLLERYEEYIELSAIGFPENWKGLLYNRNLIKLVPVKR